MKRFLALGAMALALVLTLADEASAQRRGGFGGAGFRGGFGGAGFRGGAVGFRGGFAGARIGGIGTRSFAAVRPGFRGVFRPGFRRAGLGWGGWGWAGRSWAFAGRPWGWRGARFRRAGFGWGWPLAAAGLGYASYASSSCLVWDGIQWVNTFSYSYGYPSYSLGYGWGGWGGGWGGWGW